MSLESGGFDIMMTSYQESMEIDDLGMMSYQD